MTIAFRQSVTLNETSAATANPQLPSPPLPGSALIAAIATGSGVGATSFSHDDARWNLLSENAGDDADEKGGVVLRAQIWAAFDIPAGTGDKIEISFSGGSSKRGIIIAEYTGDVFQFPNPADRVVKDNGTTAAFTIGDIDTGNSGDTREDDELFVGVAAADATVVFSNPTAPMAIRVTAVPIGIAGSGVMALLDAFVSSTQKGRLKLDHDAVPPVVVWVAVVAAIRGNLQVPATPVAAPTVGEPITENEDHEGDAIGHLLEQFKSHDKR